jgi:hypothetical protein
LDDIKRLRFVDESAVGWFSKGVDGTGIYQARYARPVHCRDDILRPFQVDTLRFRIQPGCETDTACQVIDQAYTMHGTFERVCIQNIPGDNFHIRPCQGKRRFTGAHEHLDALGAPKQFTHKDIPDVTGCAGDKIHGLSPLKTQPLVLF